MLPPQAPPAITTAQNQPAIDALTRLATAQNWLIDGRLAMPSAPAGNTEVDNDAFLASLDAYWSAMVPPVSSQPGAMPVTRVAALAATLGGVMRDTATLRHDDRTLDERGVAWVLAALRTDGAMPPDGIQPRELMFGQVPYAGALILTHASEPDLAMLFSPGTGWESFASLPQLHDAVEERVRIQLAQHEVAIGILDEDLQAVTGSAFVTSRPIEGDVRSTLAARIVEVQQEKATEAWDDLTGGLIDATAWHDDLMDILDLPRYVGIRGVLDRREQRLVDQLVDEQLADVPAEARAQWHAMRDAYRTELRVAARSRREGGLSEPLSFDDFTRDSLDERLAALGVAEKSSNILVDVEQQPDLLKPLKAIWTLINGRDVATVTLGELAATNIGGMEQSVFRAHTRDGESLQGALSSATLKTLVRDANVGGRYRQYIDDTLRASTEGQLSRAIALSLHKARMRFEAADARLSYFIDGGPGAFRAAHDQRGFAWVQAVLDAPDAATRARVQGHDIVVRQLVYRGAPVRDVLVIGTKTPQSVASVVLYTPDAPDGVAFREFDDRAAVAKQFLYHPAFERYLLDRLPAAFAEALPNGQERFRLADATRRAHWVFAPAGGAPYTKVEEPFSEKAVEGSFLGVLHDTAVSQIVRNVEAITRSTASADWDAVAMAARRVGESTQLAQRFLEGAVIETVAGASRVMPSFWQAYDDVKAGDIGGGVVSAVDGYVSSLNVIGLHPTRLLAAPGALVRTGARSRAAIAPVRAVRDPAAVFEARYRAPGIRVDQARSVDDGIYRIGEASYIRHEGAMYRVGMDTAGGTWRLSTSSPLDARVTGPAIEKTPTGLWRYRTDMGLRGGTGRGAGSSVDDASDRLLAAVRGNPDIASLTNHQQRVLFQELQRRFPQRTADLLRVMRVGGRHGTSRLSAEESRMWWEALAVARNTRRHAIRPRNQVTGTGPTAGAVDLTTPAPVGLEQVLPADWPTTLYSYAGPAHGAPQVHGDRFVPQAIRPLRALANPAATETLAAGHNPPVSGALLVSDVPYRRGYWLRIDMSRLATRTTMNGHARFNLLRSTEPGASNFLIRPAATPFDPHATDSIWLRPTDYTIVTSP